MILAVELKAFPMQKNTADSTPTVEAASVSASCSFIGAGVQQCVFAGSNVRAEAGPTAKRQARVVENAPAHFAGLVF